MFKQILFSYLRRLKRDDISTYAAQIAFFSILSIVPFLLVLSMLLDYSGLLDLRAAVKMLEESLELSETAVYYIDSLFFGMNGSTTLFSFSTLTILWSSSRMVRAIMKGIHMAFRERDTRSIFLTYLLSILYILLLSVALFLLLVLFLYGTRIWDILQKFGIDSHFFTFLWTAGRLILPLGVIFLVFWSMYRLFPTRSVTIWDSLPGALFSTILLFVLSVILSIMITMTGDYSVLYGSLSNVVVILFWFWFFGYAVMLGMELNGVLFEDMEYQYYASHLKERRRARKEERREKRIRAFEAREKRRFEKAHSWTPYVPAETSVEETKNEDHNPAL